MDAAHLASNAFTSNTGSSEVHGAGVGAGVGVVIDSSRNFERRRSTGSGVIDAAEVGVTEGAAVGVIIGATGCLSAGKALSRAGADAFSSWNRPSKYARTI